MAATDLTWFADKPPTNDAENILDFQAYEFSATEIRHLAQAQQGST